ncbi:MAG: ABC transporter permease [Acidobacteriota bacterium]|nr:ABC transporter permease [Acidobacteriota bacterium]
MRFLLDLRFAARRLTASPGYTVAAVATLALAIGASTAIFSAVYAVLLKPMPIRQPEQLAVAWGGGAALAYRVVELSYLDIRDMGEAAPRVGKVASYGTAAWSAVLDGQGEPVRLAQFGVSGTFFEVMGAAPRLGRMLGPDDDVPNAPPVAVLSHGTWLQQFGGDPNVVGRKISLDDQMTEVVGVMPEAFDYPRGAQLWTPSVPVVAAIPKISNPDPLRNIGLFFLVARLNPGVTTAMAADEWTRINAKLLENSPGPRYGISATSFLEHHIGPARQAMWALFGAVGVLLTIACANVSGLMLTRVALRNQDDAIRLAIGGSRAAIARLWAAETLWLAVVGGALGLLTCQWFIRAIIALAPEGIPRLDEVAIDVPVALFSVTVMAVATLLCGAAPIRHASVLNLVETLNEGSRTVAGGRSYRTRSSLLVVQIGLAVALLVAAGLVVRSFQALQHLDVGFQGESLLRLKVEPRGQSQSTSVWIHDLLPQIAAMPAVDSVGGVYLTPLELGSIGQGSWALAEGQPETSQTASSNPIVNYLTATPDYFKAMRIRITRGRAFTDADGANAPRVAIISESTAAAFFPGQNPIGKRIKLAAFSTTPNPDGAWRTIVGVTSSVRYRGLNEIQLDLYDPQLQSRLAATSLVVRMKSGEEHNRLAVAAAIQTQAKHLDPRVLVSGITTLEDVVNKERAPWRFSAWVFALFAALAFALSMLGLFSLVSLDVVNRRREFAIRMAIGATNRHIVGGVFRSAGTRAAIGIALGLAVALVATRGLQSLLFGVALTDGLTYGSVVAMVVTVVAVASYLPARRAASSAPLALLRRD